ncbi:hypothetical protein [Nocardia sp. NPDC055049]
MSSGQKPRTPEHFPRMKYRARKRHTPELEFPAVPAALHVSFAGLADRLEAAFRRMSAALADLGLGVDR